MFRPVLSPAFLSGCALAMSLSAAASLGAQAPSSAFKPEPFSIRAEWLQANASLSRSTMPSNAITLAYEGERVGYTAGFLRIARDLSTVEGGTIGVELGARSNRARVTLGAQGLVGVVMASADTTGYDAIGAGGVVVHTPRYDYSRGTALGVGGTLAFEYDVMAHLGLRATASAWTFTGTPFGTEKTRTTLGVGIAIPFGGLTPLMRGGK
jgi:hypothetical protein